MAIPREFLSDVEKTYHSLQSVALHTPLQRHEYLSEKYDCNIWFKREDLQAVRSYKIRGAYNLIASLGRAEKDRGVVCASAGNHAQGFAYTCKLLGIKGVVFMPLVTPKQKISQVRLFGGHQISIQLTGDNFDECAAEARKYVDQSGQTFIPPFDHEKIIEGQATVGYEIMKDLPDTDYIVCPVGGGGLAAGIGCYLAQQDKEVKLVGVEPAGAASMTLALQSGQPVALTEMDRFVDGAAVKRVGDLNFSICRHALYKMLTVPEGKICTSILKLYNNYGIVAEPAGALSVSVLDDLAGEIKNKNVVCIISGGNNDIDRMQEIKERSLLYEGIKHYFIIRIPQRPGAFLDFANQILGKDDDIVRFEYMKKNNKEEGPVLVGIELKSKADYQPLIQRLTGNHFQYIELNKQEDLMNIIL